MAEGPLAVSSFEWMAEVAEVLRDELGDEALKVPKRSVPDLMVRAMGLFDPGIRSIVDCARSMLHRA
jgi:dihydroflavonol-4-reductase